MLNLGIQMINSGLNAPDFGMDLLNIKQRIENVNIQVQNVIMHINNQIQNRQILNVMMMQTPNMGVMFKKMNENQVKNIKENEYKFNVIIKDLSGKKVGLQIS